MAEETEEQDVNQEEEVDSSTTEETSEQPEDANEAVEEEVTEEETEDARDARIRELSQEKAEMRVLLDRVLEMNNRPTGPSFRQEPEDEIIEGEDPAEAKRRMNAKKAAERVARLEQGYGATLDKLDLMDVVNDSKIGPKYAKYKTEVEQYRRDRYNQTGLVLTRKEALATVLLEKGDTGTAPKKKIVKQPIKPGGVTKSSSGSKGVEKPKSTAKERLEGKIF